jgi:hypothetical protein
MYILYSRILRHLSLFFISLSSFFELAFICLDFLWSGTLIFAFSFGSWWRIRSVQKKTATTTGSNTKMTDPLQRSKRRLMGIAMQTSCCLLLNMVHALRLFAFWSCVVVFAAFLYKTFCLKLDCHAMIISKVYGVLSIAAIVGCYNYNPCDSRGMEHHDGYLAHL